MMEVVYLERVYVNGNKREKRITVMVVHNTHNSSRIVFISTAKIMC